MEENSKQIDQQSIETEAITVSKPAPKSKPGRGVGSYKRHIDNTLNTMRTIVREELDSYKQRKAEERERKEREEQERKQQEEEQRLFNEWKMSRNKKVPEPESEPEPEPEPEVVEPVKKVIRKKAAPKKVARKPKQAPVESQEQPRYYYDNNVSIFD